MSQQGHPNQITLQTRLQNGQNLQLEQGLQLNLGTDSDLQHRPSQIRNDSGSPELDTKLPRATLEEKIHILNYYHRSGKLQSDTVEQFKNQFAISTSSFSEWLKHESDLRERYNQSLSLTEMSGNHVRKSKRKVRFKYEKINKAMDLLVERRLLDGLSINEPILRDHWAIYAREYGVDDPKRLYSFSHGWLSQFKKRHGLDKKTMVEVRSGNSRSPSRMPSSKSSDENTATTDGRFYEMSQLLNSPQQQLSNGGAAPNNSMNGSDVDPNARYNDPNDHEQNLQQQRLQQNHNNTPFNPLLTQVPGAFGNQTYPMMAPYIRLDNQVNRNNNTNTNLLLTSLNGQQQLQMSVLTPNQALQLQMVLRRLLPHIRNGLLGNNINNGNNHANNNNNNNNNNHRNNSNNGNNNINNSNILDKSLLSGNGQNMTDVNGRISDLAGNDHMDINGEIVNAVNGQQMVEGSPADVVSDEDLFNISMEDIEKFMYQWCDKFFHDHQMQFPKTSKIFRNFKDSFMREKFKAMMSSGNLSKFPTESADNSISASVNSSGDNDNTSNVSVDNFFLRNVQPRASSQSRSD